MIRLKTFISFSITAGLLVLLTASCAKNSATAGAPDGNVDSSRELATHSEVTAEGSKMITKVTEERDGTDYIIRVQIIKNGEIKETVHRFDNPNFMIKIPVSEQIEITSTEEAAEHPDAHIIAFAQHLEKTRSFMLKTDYVAALSEVNQALKVDPKNTKALMMRGSIYYAMGKVDLAEEDYETVLRVDPHNPEVKAFRNYLSAKTKKNAPANE